MQFASELSHQNFSVQIPLCQKNYNLKSSLCIKRIPALLFFRSRGECMMEGGYDGL